ncbi:hypothetical protein [Trinickia dabaoshanensis]|uniref:hypothetical protein n=1 Tax=Trinickia dabaoshanensis TaxID=564714 RepID=UPI001E3D03AB|nr:hypothetical protein [Trinickia dabaoshanensis]
MVLHDEVAGVAVVAQSLRTWHTKQLDADTKRRSQIRQIGRGVAGESHPRIESIARENTDFQILGNPLEHFEPAVSDPMQFAEYRSLGRPLTILNAALLRHIHEKFSQAIRALIALGKTGGNDVFVLLHVFLGMSPSRL